MVFSTASFPPVSREKRLDLKSLKGRTKAEEEGPPVRAVSQEKLMENLQSKTPYKFKKSYGGTPEPQTAQDAPWLHGPSLKNTRVLECTRPYPAVQL